MAWRRINTACRPERPRTPAAATHPPLDGITKELWQHVEAHQQPDQDDEQLYTERRTFRREKVAITIAGKEGEQDAQDTETKQGGQAGVEDAHVNEVTSRCFQGCNSSFWLEDCCTELRSTQLERAHSIDAPGEHFPPHIDGIACRHATARDAASATLITGFAQTSTVLLPDT